MSRYCNVNAPERCEEVFERLYPEEDYDEIQARDSKRDPEAEKMMSGLCTACGEDRQVEFELYYGERMRENS